MKYDICVLGGCSLDETYFQKLDGTFSDEPDIVAPGGKGANQAVASARAGAKTVILTRLGNDEKGKIILNNLNQNKIDTSYIEMVDGLENDSTKIKVNVFNKKSTKERFIDATNSFTPDMIEKYKDVILSSKIILCQLKPKKEVTEALINFCYDNNKALVLTPDCPEKFRYSDFKNRELYAKVAMIICNKKECVQMFETDNITRYIQMFPNKLVVTLGDEGLVYHNGEAYVHHPAVKTEVVDTVGAGDTLTGNAVFYLLQGNDLNKSLRKAMYAASLKITQPTAQKGMPYPEDVRLFIKHKNRKEFEYKEELKYGLEIVKSAYETIRSNDTSKIHTQEDNTIITDADIALEKYIINKIKEKFPNDKFITEEYNPNNAIQNRTWIIDPIDGITHFINSEGSWGIQLAFYDKKYTKFGIIYMPEKDELYYAAENQGVFLNNEKLELPKNVPLRESIVEFGGSLSNGYDIKEECLNSLLLDPRKSVQNIIYIKSCCNAYTNILTGKTNALITAATSPWDVMPGELMCRELGIEIVYLDIHKKVKLFTNSEEIKDVLIPII